MERNNRLFGYHIILTEQYDRALLHMEREFRKTWRSAKGVFDADSPENEQEFFSETEEDIKRQNEEEFHRLIARHGRNEGAAAEAVFSNCVFDSSDETCLARVVVSLEQAGVAHVVDKSEDPSGLIFWRVSVACADQQKAAGIVEEVTLLVKEARSPMQCANCGTGMITSEESEKDADGGLLYLEYRCRKCGRAQMVSCE